MFKRTEFLTFALFSGRQNLNINSSAIVRQIQKLEDRLQTKFDYESVTYLPKNRMDQYFDSPYYKSAMYDSECGQIHPLNYCLGLARELLKNQNCKIFEDTGVISYESQKKVTITTEKI